MQLEQNLFSIYRLVLRLPKFIFVAAILFFLVVSIIQVIYMYHISRTVNLGPCLLDYMIDKNNQTSQQLKNDNITENATNTEFNFLNEKTLLHLRFGPNQSCTHQLNYSYQYGTTQLPFMIMMENQYLVNLRKQNPQYFKQHEITYDLISMPIMNITPPLFAFYFDMHMLQTQIIMQSLRYSFFQLEKQFNDYKITHNMLEISISISQLHLSYFQFSNNQVYQSSINYFSFIAQKFYPSYFFKLYYGMALFTLLIVINIFIGLFLRYIIIFSYTIFLVIYDKCLRERWGWVHQYLAILYQRFQQNRLATLKMIVFLVISQIGMPCILAFGAYCILKVLFLPLLSYLLHFGDYVIFYLKTLFFIQIFHYIFCRSRTTLKFFPIISFAVSYCTVLLWALNNNYGCNILIINLNLSIQFLIFFTFLLIQKSIIQENQKGLIGDFCPSIYKPRMLFYAGYDVSWERSLPPMWTYFTRWFDYSYFNEAQRCLLEKDYQLLYGLMLGLNERQQIPQTDIQLRQQIQLQDQPSNQMNLIQQ